MAGSRGRAELGSAAPGGCRSAVVVLVASASRECNPQHASILEHVRQRVPPFMRIRRLEFAECQRPFRERSAGSSCGAASTRGAAARHGARRNSGRKTCRSSGPSARRRRRSDHAGGQRRIRAELRLGHERRAAALSHRRRRAEGGRRRRRRRTPAPVARHQSAFAYSFAQLDAAGRAAGARPAGRRPRARASGSASGHRTAPSGC